MQPNITVYCEHVSDNSVHCNKYNTLIMQGRSETVSEVIEESKWEIRNDKIYCPEHAE
jgi:hypothetical protein